MNILIDTNVLSLAVLANTISLQAGALSNRIVLWQAKPRPEPTKETELYAIASLCAAAEAGVLTFWSSIGVKAESYRGRSWPKQNEYSLLRNINLRHAESAISYRNLGVDLGEHGEIRSIVDLLLGSQAVPESIITRANLERLKRICKSLHPNHYADAIILLDAEHNQLEYFVTADKKFLNALGANKALGLRCHYCTPSKLCESLEIEPLRKLPFDFGERYLLSGRKGDIIFDKPDVAA